jgi:DNA-binding response OmpR family regulator
MKETDAELRGVAEEAPDMPETVLVVDDEPFILRSLSFVLERAGFRVVQARNGDEALTVLRDVRPRLAILDVMMPKRNGYEVCAIAKGDPDLRDTYVILLTAKGQDSARDHAIEAGADEFMTKPFSPSRIVERVREVLESRHGAEAPAVGELV